MNPAKRILVVDDEPTILFMLKQILTAEGYEVVTASNGEEAERLSRIQWYDLFLVDLVLPRKDGIETILSLRTFWRNTPIIAMSGSWHCGTPSCHSLAEKLGACGTLEKPFDRETLLNMVRALMESVPRKPDHRQHCNNLRRIAIRVHWKREVIAERARRWSNRFITSHARSLGGASCDWEAKQVDACGPSAQIAPLQDVIKIAHAG